VKHTRNYFTHWSSKPSRKWVTFGLDLLNVTESARWLLEALLLGQLGLSADRVESLLARNERLKRARTSTPLY
jgi:hypothetical protein